MSKFKVGDKVIIDTDSIWRKHKGLIGVVTRLNCEEYSYLLVNFHNYDNDEEGSAIFPEEVRLCTPLDELI